VADAAEQAEIEGAGKARASQKIDQSPQVAPATPLATAPPGPTSNTTPSPDQEDAGA
jgi:hypothetical protein